MDPDFKKFIESTLLPKTNATNYFRWSSVSGGSINETYKISGNGHSYFIKTNTRNVFKNGFEEEVLGLKFLGANNCTVPSIVNFGSFNENIYLILEWIETGPKTSNFWINFSGQLADLHRNNNELFGFEQDNFMGELAQKNDFYGNFTDFFIENRLYPQTRLAFDKGLLNPKQLSHFQNLYKQLSTIIPKEEPSAIHGDLWSGNFICNQQEEVVFIDPAVYYGHRETDLAMTTLFGGFSNEFYENYQLIYPLEKGFNSRKDILNLYPLLIHLNLFGSSYLRSIESIISGY